MNDSPSAAPSRTAKSSLVELAKLAGLPEAAADSVEITGSDPVFPTRFRPVVVCFSADRMAHVSRPGRTSGA